MFKLSPRKSPLHNIILVKEIEKSQSNTASELVISYMVLAVEVELPR